MHQPWFNQAAFGQEAPFNDDRIRPWPPVDPAFVEEAQSVFRSGGEMIDEASITARERVPLRGRPQVAMIATTAVAAGIGSMLGKRPVVAALAGAAIGWFAHKTWMR